MEALIALYEATNGATGWLDNTGWLGDDDACNWHGIRCNMTNYYGHTVLGAEFWKVNIRSQYK